MLTDDQDKTAVYPTETAADPTARMHTPRTGRNSPVLRAGIVVATFTLLIGVWLVLSMLLPDRDTTDTISSSETNGAIETADTQPDGGSEPATKTENAVDTSLNGADVPADLAPVVDTIDASIQRLEPSIGTVYVSQEVVDFLQSQQPIDTEAVLVDSCTDAYCWIWLHGDALELRVTVTRDGGAMLLMAVG